MIGEKGERKTLKSNKKEKVCCTGKCIPKPNSPKINVAECYKDPWLFVQVKTRL